MEKQVIEVIASTFHEAVRKYRQIEQDAKRHNLGLRPRQFVFHGADGTRMVWPSPDSRFTQDATHYCTAYYTNGDTYDVHYNVDVSPCRAIRYLVKDDPRAAMRVLRQVEIFRDWVNAREDGVRRALNAKSGRIKKKEQPH